MTKGKIEELHEIHLDPINYNEMTEDNATSLWLHSPSVIPDSATTIARHRYNHRANEGRQLWYDKCVCYVGLPQHLAKESTILTEQWEGEYSKLPLGYIADLYYVTDYSLPVTLRLNSEDYAQNTKTGRSVPMLIHTEIAQCLSFIEQCDDIFEGTVYEKSQQLAHCIVFHLNNTREAVSVMTSLAFCTEAKAGNASLVHDVMGKQIEDAIGVINQAEPWGMHEFSEEHLGIVGIELDEYEARLQIMLNDNFDKTKYDERYKYAYDMIKRSEQV